MNLLKQVFGAYFTWLSRPFKWWFRKDRKNPQISYAMSIEGVPNKNNWIIGAVVSFVFECDVTKNTTTTIQVVKFRDSDTIFAADRAADDDDVKESLATQVQKYINIREQIAAARKTINTQVLIEAGIVALLSLLPVILVINWYNSFLQAGINGY